MSKTFRRVLEENCETEPDVSLLQMINGKRADSATGKIFDDHILRWWDCRVLVYRMDYVKNLLQVAVEGEPHDWGL